MRGIIHAVCVSDRKGVAKKPVSEAQLIENYGLDGDAHAGSWHRQVSLLSADRIRAFNESGANVSDGDFGENLVSDGIDFSALPVGTVFRLSGGAELELTQIGKACHDVCAIRKRVGTCIMPAHGVFAIVRKGGTVKPGDTIDVLMPDPKRPFTAAVITVSDRSAAGIREDLSGPAAEKLLKEAGYRIIETLIIPDEKVRIETELKRLCDQRQVSLIITTGGTGFSLRDVTPEAAMAVMDRNAPGIAEAIRMKSLQITDRAMLSRGVSVIRKQTLIVTLPGSPKAVAESLDGIPEALSHGLGILRGSATD